MFSIHYPPLYILREAVHVNPLKLIKIYSNNSDFMMILKITGIIIVP